MFGFRCSWGFFFLAGGKVCLSRKSYILNSRYGNSLRFGLKLQSCKEVSDLFLPVAFVCYQPEHL